MRIHQLSFTGLKADSHKSSAFPWLPGISHAEIFLSLEERRRLLKTIPPPPNYYQAVISSWLENL